MRSGLPYADLLQQQITAPLRMSDTAVDLTPAMKLRAVQGHDAKHSPAEAWTFADLPGAGGLHSTAADMLTYLQAQLHPEQLHLQGAPISLPAAITMTHQIRNTANDGRTGGVITYAIFDPVHDAPSSFSRTQRRLPNP